MGSVLEEASGEQRGDLGNCPRQERGGKSWQKPLLRAAWMGCSLAAKPPRLWGEPLYVQRVTFFGEGVFFKYHYSFPGLLPKVQPGKNRAGGKKKERRFRIAACCTRLPRGGRPTPGLVPAFPRDFGALHPSVATPWGWTPAPQSRGDVSPLFAGPGKAGGRFVGRFAAYILVNSIRGSNRSGVSGSDELFLWQWRAAARLLLLGTPTYKSPLPPGPHGSC